MLAIHRDGTKIMLHDPRNRIVVPLLVNLETGVMTISLPQIAEMAEDYIAFPSLVDLKRSARIHDRVIDRAVRFSRHYSDLLALDPPEPSVKIDRLRSVVTRHYEEHRVEIDRKIGNVGDASDLLLAPRERVGAIV